MLHFTAYNTARRETPHHGRYLQAVTQGGARYRLDGTEEGDITDYQRQLAVETLAKRQAPKG